MSENPNTETTIKKAPAAGGGPSAVAAITLVIGLAAGAAIGFQLGKSVARSGTYDEGLAAGKAAAERAATEALVNAGIIPKDEAVMTISGTVRAIEGDTLVIESRLATVNPLAEPAPAVRRVRVTSATSIVGMMEKDPGTLVAEQQAFSETLEARGGEASGTGADPRPPETTISEALSLSDIAVGSSVRVTASTDIARAESFEATEVRLVSQAGETQPGEPLPEIDPSTADDTETGPRPTEYDAPEPQALP